MANNAINSLAFGGNTYTFTLPYGTCSTSTDTAAKVVTVDNFSLETGARVAVKFTETNTKANATLNVNSTGAKTIYYDGTALTSSNSNVLQGSKIYEFIYNGTQWDLVGDINAILPVNRGGTGSANGATGLKNLLAAGKTVLSSHQYGSTFPSSPSDGTLFFKESTGGIDEISDTLVTDLMLRAYPVGSIYMSVSSTSPAALFGGTWTQLKDRFLIGAGDSYSNGATGGSSIHTLTQNEMPNHYHSAYINALGGSTNGTTSAGWFAVLKDSSIYYNYGNGVTNTVAVATGINQGGGAAHNNMPPYLTVYMWKRTA